MDQITEKQTLSLTGVCIDAKEELPFSGEYVLPEYAPDVASVLKCVVTPLVTDQHFAQEQLIVSGQATVVILYLDEERKCIRRAEYSEPFSTALHARQESACPVEIDICTAYMTCRAVSPRRFEVRGGFSIRAYAPCAYDASVALPQEGEGLYCQTRLYASAAPSGSAQKGVTVRETLDFPTDCPPVELLLCGEAYARIDECKLIAGKVIVKGQVYLHELYTDDSGKGSTHTLDFQLPYSQILDIADASENGICDAHVAVSSVAVRPALNGDGVTRCLEAEIRLQIQVQLYIHAEIQIITDAFHAAMPCRPECAAIPLCRPLETRYLTVPIRKSLDWPVRDRQEILDLWVSPQIIGQRVEDGMAKIDGKMNVSMLLRDGDGTVAYYERTEDFSAEAPAVGNEVRTSLTVCEVSYSATDAAIELDVRLAAALHLRQCEECHAVTDICLAGDRAYEPDDATMRLYYAQAGERVWEIARHCRTSPAGIVRENGLDGDVLPSDAALLIPIE